MFNSLLFLLYLQYGFNFQTVDFEDLIANAEQPLIVETNQVPSDKKNKFVNVHTPNRFAPLRPIASLWNNIKHIGINKEQEIKLQKLCSEYMPGVNCRLINFGNRFDAIFQGINGDLYFSLTSEMKDQLLNQSYFEKFIRNNFGHLLDVDDTIFIQNSGEHFLLGAELKKAAKEKKVWVQRIHALLAIGIPVFYLLMPESSSMNHHVGQAAGQAIQMTMDGQMPHLVHLGHQVIGKIWSNAPNAMKAMWLYMLTHQFQPGHGK